MEAILNWYMIILIMLLSAWVFNGIVYFPLICYNIL